MEEILKNLQDPSWWFNGVFFLLIGLVISFLFKKTPTWLKKYARSTIAKRLKKIKNLRWKKWETHWLIAIERSYFIVFIILCFFYIAILLTSPFAIIFKEAPLIGFLFSSPIYIFEILWLIKNDFLKELIKHAEKIR